MPTPFPGMDPYLEHPHLWPNVHHSLITAIRDDLSVRLRPKYFVDIEIETVIALPLDPPYRPVPDVVVVRPGDPPGGIHEAVAAYEAPGPESVELPEARRQGYLEIRTVADDTVVTVVELLSPFNKRAGLGRANYERKRFRILRSRAHFVEIDLLRAGQPMPMSRRGRRSDYRVLVSPCELRPSATLYAFDVNQAIPRFPIPLLAGDDAPDLDLGPILRAVYDRAGYDMRIDYRREPVPPLRLAATAWADGLLRAAGRRSTEDA